MTDFVGALLGHYTVVAKLGEGGMGEVYQARDEHLGREVAIKVLPEAVAQDPERLARFGREARLLASLSHQNVATLHGLEEHEGRRYLVMELAEGETLAARITRGPIPIEDALDYAGQIARGLEAAHAQGIVHRDLKPANVMFSPAGKVKVLDFGLAKVWQTEGSDAELTHSPTLTADMTRAGVLLGTAAYMSPEQARGRSVDKRTDIWAFGCVLYEMLTGQRPFLGSDVSEVLATILKDEPDWKALPIETPTAVRRVLRWCLQKDPDRRLHDIADARIGIESTTEDDLEPAPARSEPRWGSAARHAAAVGLIALGIVAGGAVGLWWSARTTPEEPLALQVETVEQLPWNRGVNQHVAISPDGRHLVYVVGDDVVGGQRQLIHRPLGAFKSTVIPGSDGAAFPFFSPDSQWVGFSAEDSLEKVRLEGGQPVELCEDCGGSAAWSPDGREIIFARHRSLMRITAAGGEVTVISQPTEERKVYSRPQYLPNGGAVLLEVCDRDSRVCDVGLLHLENERLEVLIRNGSNPVYAPSGHLVFARNEELYAVAFDANRRSCTGEPVKVFQGVSYVGERDSQYSLSGTGVLAFVELAPGSWGDPGRSLMWVDRTGNPSPLTERRGAFGYLELSPDGTRVAVQFIEGMGVAQIEIYEINTATWTRLTTGGGYKTEPVWTPDGSRVVFANNIGGKYSVFSSATDFSSDEAAELFIHEHHAYPDSFSPSGDLVFTERIGVQDMNIVRLPAAGGEVGDQVHTPFAEYGGAVSPNGSWLTYISNRSGVNEVYVEAFPDGGPRTQVSSGGGTNPRWAPGGDELFYWEDNRLTAVQVRTEPDFALLSERRVLFESDALETSDYDVDRDGLRFLLVEKSAQDLLEDRTRQRVNLIFNWFEELERLVPTE